MEEETQTLTSPSTEGISDGTESQETAPTPQGIAQPQAVEQATVEAPAQPTSSPSAARLRPSEYYEIRDLKKQFASLKSSIEGLQSSLTKAPQPSAQSEAIDPEKLSKAEQEKFWADPWKYQQDHGKNLEEKIQKKIEEKFSQFDISFPERLAKIEHEKQFRQQEREALKILFPESGKVPNADVQEVISRFPDRAAKIQRIIQDYGLAPALDSNPKIAAAAIIKLLGEQPGTPIPGGPKKSQMAAVSSGNANGSGGRKITLEELRAEKTKLEMEVAKNPELRGDPAFIKRLTALSDNWATLVKQSQAG